jgi:poly(hydroxyalkanoate) depolymerase family esterase
MNSHIEAAMQKAATLTRAGDLAEATRLIQEALGRTGTPPPPARDGSAKPALPGPNIIDLKAERPTDSANLWVKVPQGVMQRPRRPLGEVLGALRAGRLAATLPTGLMKPSPVVEVPDGASYDWRTFSCAAGTRRYRLYRPASASQQPEGIVLMLHGCKQDPDDFAVGTGMNGVAEAHGMLVVYPHQTSAANPSACWNWFNPSDQARDNGEPAILAGIARDLMREHGLDRDRVFVAGLSAGGAMAAILARAYPDVFSAAGIHSGLPAGSARDVVSAFAAMRGDAGAVPPDGSSDVRLIVFHGTADSVVHPSNADRIIAAARGEGLEAPSVHEGRSARGRAYRRTIEHDRHAIARVEQWQLHGAGHAWAGGSHDGSYTDPDGPDASMEMVRFFLRKDRPDAAR